jgi:hypothetical protein
LVTCAKSFLTGRVPDLELDDFAVNVDRTNLKVDANRADETLRVRVIRKSQQ